MPLPLMPIAALTLRTGAIVAAGYAAWRVLPRKASRHIDENALDDVDEGLEMSRDRQQVNVRTGFCRTIRLGRSGPGITIDARALGRIRFGAAG